jgi:hypothetical protein
LKGAVKVIRNTNSRKRTLSLVTLLGLLVAGVMVLGTSTSSMASTDPSFECPEGSEWNDDNGDGVATLEECTFIIVDPDLRGAVTVKARCGFLKVTNHENRVMRFRYGRSLQNPDNIVKVASGATRKINTSRRSIDWKASWPHKDPRVGHNLRVRQNCGSSSVKPTVVNPTALPNTGA